MFWSSDDQSKEEKNNLYKDIDKQKIINPIEAQNKKLRLKLKQLTLKLEDQRQKNNEEKSKPVKYVSTSPAESQTLQLQNAYKIIDRLQKTVREFQNKESYQLSLQKIQQLESVIKNLETQTQQIKTQIKITKKTLKEKQIYLTQLSENSKQLATTSEDKETISKLKKKLRQLVSENQNLQKKQLIRHQKLVIAQKKLNIFQNEDDQVPISVNANIKKQIQQQKQKLQECMERIQRQKQYIAKLNQKMANDHFRRKQPKSQEKRSKQISNSMEQLPDLNRKKIILDGIFDYIPSHRPSPLKRY